VEPTANEPLSLAVLAGGRGERLGADKAALLLAGEPLLARVLRRLAPLSDDVSVVLRPGQALAAPPGVRLATDLAPYGGALAALAAGIAAARHAWVAVVACDMPYAAPDPLRAMAALARGADAVVPRLAVGLEPLYALYHRRCLGAITAALARGERRLSAFHPDVRVRYVSPEEIGARPELWLNINTADDLAAAERLLSDT
jgi:molybdopterin-guanine dinucleotide biosynthesis protein A